MSAASRLGLGDMLDEVVKHFPEGGGEEEEDDRPRVASWASPTWKILDHQQADRGEPGHRLQYRGHPDAIDTEVRRNGKDYIFIDTAGLRRKNKIKEELERYSIIRTVTAVERADVVILVIDATEGVTEQDAKIAGIAHERGKGIIIAVNKWDASRRMTRTVYEYTNKIRTVLSYMPYAEIAFISAVTGQRLPKLF